MLRDPWSRGLVNVALFLPVMLAVYAAGFVLFPSYDFYQAFSLCHGVAQPQP